MKYAAILFDLDGTLLDSAPDLIHTLNDLLQVYGRDSVDYELFSRWVSHGSGKLLELGFAGDYPIDFQQLRQQYLDCYQKQNTVYSDFFAGVPALLTAIEATHTPWGIMTNKPTRPTLPIAKHFALDKRAKSIVCGDTLTVSKPHPAPLLFLAEQLGVNPAHCVYIGDCDRDITAGKQAGMMTIACAYGYIPPDDDITTWGADVIVQTPLEILQYIQ